MFKQYPGAAGITYDSKAEAAASHELAKLGCAPVRQLLPQTFTDANGERFNAKADFYNARCGTFIEFKAGSLNGKKTKANADKALASKEQFKGFLSIFDYICHAWHHSKNKQAIVQRSLTPQNFVVVFQTPPTLAEAIAYKDAGIVFVPMSALSKYLSYVRLVKAGLAATFSLTYSTDEAGDLTFSIH